MSQFYIVGANEDVARCRESLSRKTTITISGTTADGKLGAFTGIVQSIENDVKRDPARQWRITMTDTATPVWSGAPL